MRGQLSREGGFRFGDQSLKGLRFVNSKISQDFPVDLNASDAKAVDKSSVCHAFKAGGCIDPLDPQRAELALAYLAVAVSILPGLLNGLIGNPEGVFPAAIIAFGFLDNFTVAGVRCDAPFYACHGLAPSNSFNLGEGVNLVQPPKSAVRQKLSDNPRILFFQDGSAALVAQRLVGPFDHSVLLASLARAHFSRSGELETLLSATLRLQLRHFACPLKGLGFYPCCRFLSSLGMPYRPGGSIS